MADPHPVTPGKKPSAHPTKADTSTAEITPPLTRIVPTDLDVLFGRGEPTRTHPGNVVLRKLVNKYLEGYINASKQEKTSIIRQVIQGIDDSGGRYLVPLDTSCRHAIFTVGCREASKAEVRSKVSHAFRDGERRVLQERERALVQSQQAKQSSLVQEPDLAMKDYNATTISTNGEPATVSPHTVSDFPLSRSEDASTSKHPTAERPTSENPLFSLATILTSMGDISSVSTRSIIDKSSSPSNRLDALSNFATSSLSAIEGQKKSLSASIKPVAKKRQHLTVKATGQKRNPQKSRSGTSTISPVAASLKKYCREGDVVFGRGAPLRQHPGNVKFRATVAKYSYRYLNGHKHEKTAIIQRVIQELQQQHDDEEKGARFLMMNEDGLGVTEATQDEIRMKVSHRFRDFPKSSSSLIPDNNAKRPGSSRKMRATATTKGSTPADTTGVIEAV